MGSKSDDKEREARRKKLRVDFSNHENSVTLIGSLEAWFDFRWGNKGRETPGLLDYFNRFPHDGELTPDFEVRFHTPYTIWGECKKQLNPSFPADTKQLVEYALRSAASTSGGHHDVLVLVPPENDTTAARAIRQARELLIAEHEAKEQKRFEAEKLAYEAAVAPTSEGAIALKPPTPSRKIQLSAIVVLSYYLDRESATQEWYKLKWRDEQDNSRFREPNICRDRDVPDLNKLLCDADYHPIPVNRSALDRAGRNPFINDAPPPLYTALRNYLICSTA